MKAAFSLTLALIVHLSTGLPITQAQPSCRFVLGFESLRNLVGAQKVGTCLEDEHFNLENGNAEQRTAGGLLVWRKVDNFTAFTDGGTTWVNGPGGMQSRPNSERFSWERDPVQTTQAMPLPTPTAAPNRVPTPSLVVSQPAIEGGLMPALNERCFRSSTEFGHEFASSGAPPGTGAALMALCQATAQDAGARGVDCFEWGVRQTLTNARRGVAVPGYMSAVIQQCIASGRP